MLDSAIHAELASVLPPSALLTSAEETRPYECDGLTMYRELPAAVALPEDEAQLIEVLRRCHAAGVPVVATEVSGLREAGPDAVRTVQPDGAGLANAVGQALRTPPPALPLEAFERWKTANVEARIADLHRDIETRLLSRK